jgi:hypothetical protein
VCVYVWYDFSLFPSIVWVMLVVLRVGQNSIYVGLARTIYIRCIYTVFLAGKSPNVRSYTLHIYGSGQPYIYIHGDRVLGDFPAKNTVNTPYVYGSGQP